MLPVRRQSSWVSEAAWPRHFDSGLEVFLVQTLTYTQVGGEVEG